MKAKSASRVSSEVCQVDDDNIYYMLTLDPTVKDHRVIALIIDHTSKHGECNFYRPNDQRGHCRIAPKFRVMWNDCRGKCFVHGLTCPVILDYLEELSGSETNYKNPRKGTVKATTPP